MKAALGGAAAAAALSAPRIEGFSLAPDYAAAATCDEVTNVAAFDSHSCGFSRCWPPGCTGTLNGACNNGTHQIPVSVNADGTTITATAAVAGTVRNNGSHSLAVNGIVSGEHSCNVRVFKDCANSASSDSDITYPYNSNGSANLGALTCNALVDTLPNATLSVTLSCICL